MLDTALIKQKIRSILTYLDEIAPLIRLPFKEIRQKVYFLRTLERNIQLIVDTAVDINTHIALEKAGKVPQKNVESFLLLKELGIFSESFLKEIAKSAGFRNRIVHEYEKVDPYILFRSVQKFHRLYPDYCRGIIKWLKIK